MENNFEAIKKMNPTQLAEFINDLPKKQHNLFCHKKNCARYVTCRTCIYEWLHEQADQVFY